MNWQISPWGDGGERTGGIVIYSDEITVRKQAEIALAASESRYRGLFDHMNHGVAYCRMISATGTAELDFIYLAVNTQFELLTGMNGVAGKRASAVAPRIGELDPELLRVFETVAVTGVAQKFERFMNAQGQWQAMSVYCPEKGFFVTLFDVIDARKRAEAAARQWQRAFDEAGLGIAVADANTGEIIALNMAYAKGSGYSKDELVGQDIARFYPEEELGHRADALRTANSGLGHALFESRHLRKDGTSYPVLIDVTIVRDDAGLPVSRVKIVHDLSELRQTGEALRASQARALSLFENASQGILTANSEGLIVDVNATVQALFGYSSSELIGAPVEMLLPGSLGKKHIAHRAGYHRQPRVRAMGQGMDLLARRKDGTEFSVEISLCHLPGDCGGLAMAFISDITTRKRADKEREGMIASLNGALSEKTVLLQEVHHRVKNNLAVIAALLGMQAKMLKDEDAKISLGESRQRVLSMARIHEFLYATDHLDRVAFGKYVEQLAKELSASYSIASDLIAIRIHADDIDLPVHQAIPCGLILNELLSNALKYAFPDGRAGQIVVRFIRLESGALSLACTDDGIGIPESFDWRNSTSLGLRIMNILTKQIDGELTLDRNGGGTRFELKFPGAE